MEYPVIPDKYLPNIVRDNVAYYDDGVYQTIRSTDSFEKNIPEGEAQDAVIQLAQVDDDQVVPVSTAIRGVRTVKNIRCVINVDSYNGSAPWKSSYFCMLSVRREGLGLVPINVLDQIGTQEYVGRENMPDIVVKLSYAGEVRLNSGDYLQVSVTITNGRSGTSQYHITFNTKYDIKYS